MSVRHRYLKYQGRIEISNEDLFLARLGKKRATIRLGTVDVEGDLIDLTNGDERLKVQITDVDHSRLYSQLTDQHALEDGLASIDDLRLDLKKYYGFIDPRQPMTIIRFRTVGR